MKQTVLICFFLLSLLLVGCEKEEPLNGEVFLYGIIEDVENFALPGDDWKYISDYWENEQYGEFSQENAMRVFYRGSWGIYLEGPKYTLRSQKEKYEKLCLEWGIRFDCREVESEALANVPFRVISYVVCNHGIIGMDLITESDFDADHPAGSSLANITDVGFRSMELAIQGVPYTIDETIDSVRMTDLDATTLPRIYPGMSVRITRNPEHAGTYVFQQYIYFADGKVVKRRFKRVWLEEHLALDPTENTY